MNKPLNKTSFIIVEHISEGRIYDALDLMRAQIIEMAAADLEEAFVAVKYRHSQLEKEIISGILSFEERKRRENLRVQDLLQLNRLLKLTAEEEVTTKKPVSYPEIEATIYKDVELVITANIDGYADLFHPQSPILENSLLAMEQIAENKPQLVIDIQNIQYFDVDDRTAIFQLDQYTRNTDTSVEFNANRITQVYMYAKVEDRWLIYDALPRYTEYLDI